MKTALSVFLPPGRSYNFIIAPPRLQFPRFEPTTSAYPFPDDKFGQLYEPPDLLNPFQAISPRVEKLVFILEYNVLIVPVAVSSFQTDSMIMADLARTQAIATKC